MVLGDDMVLWSIRAVPAWDIYGPASLLALLTTPTPFNLTTVIPCHCLMAMALAYCQSTQRHCVFACVPAKCECANWYTTPSHGAAECSVSVKCRPRPDAKSAARQKITTPQKKIETLWWYLDKVKKENAKWEPLLPVQSLYVRHNTLIWQENRERENTSEEEATEGRGGKQNCSQSSAFALANCTELAIFRK